RAVALGSRAVTGAWSPMTLRVARESGDSDQTPSTPRSFFGEPAARKSTGIHCSRLQVVHRTGDADGVRGVELGEHRAAIADFGNGQLDVLVRHRVDEAVIPRRPRLTDRTRTRVVSQGRLLDPLPALPTLRAGTRSHSLPTRRMRFRTESHAVVPRRMN